MHLSKLNVQKKNLRANYNKFFENQCLEEDTAILELNEKVDRKIANHICLLQLSIKPISNPYLKAKPKVYGWGTDRKFKRFF